MKRANSRMRDIAERLVALEAGEKKASATEAPAAFRVLARLRPNLAMLMGNTGFHALLLRAFALAAAEAPTLRGVQVEPDGALAGWEAQADGTKLAEDGVLLVVQLLGLLEAFIGESLTLRLLREVWPQLSPGNLDSDE